MFHKDNLEYYTLDELVTKDHLLRKVEETIERLFGSAREKGKA